MQTCMMREGGGYLFEGPLGQTASSPEVEDTTHLRSDVIIYLSDFATVFRLRGARRTQQKLRLCLPLGTGSNKHKDHVRARFCSTLEHFFKSQCGQKGTLSLGLNTT